MQSLVIRWCGWLGRVASVRTLVVLCSVTLDALRETFCLDTWRQVEVVNLRPAAVEGVSPAHRAIFSHCQLHPWVSCSCSCSIHPRMFDEA